MKTTIQENRPWSTFHSISAEDNAAMAALRAIVEPNKGCLQGTAARVPFDAIMERVVVPAGVAYEPDTVGGVPGWWCRPENARSGEAILHLHGGWFNWGSAQAFRNMVGHIAARTGVGAFVPDYRLAPEHPFPAATEDVRACYRGLSEQGFTRIAITGDSAGGNLALGLLSFATARKALGGVLPVAAAVLSPVTDLTLTGASWETRAAADPYFIRSQAAELVRSYLGNHDPADPLASPLHGELAGLPPIRVLVGDDEVLLDDSLGYVERAVAAGVDARLDVWEGMAHGFLSGIGKLAASTQALDVIGAFLAGRLMASSK
ncbi:MAG: alpha/beta hydrolase [Acidobacteriota bacterium]|nr:alpha/beta hydrolase [Acidobacteriota bacterium]